MANTCITSVAVLAAWMHDSLPAFLEMMIARRSSRIYMKKSSTMRVPATPLHVQVEASFVCHRHAHAVARRKPRMCTYIDWHSCACTRPYADCTRAYMRIVHMTYRGRKRASWHFEFAANCVGACGQCAYVCMLCVCVCIT